MSVTDTVMPNVAEVKPSPSSAGVVISELNIDRIGEGWEALCDAGRLLAEAGDRNRWALGDLANRVVKKHGENSLGQYAGEIRIWEKTLANYRTVSRFYDVSLRGEFPALAWSHYREAMRMGDVESALDLLRDTQDNEWPIEEMRRVIAKRLGKTPPAERAMDDSIYFVSLKDEGQKGGLITFRTGETVDLDILTHLVGQTVRVVIYESE